MIRPLAKKSNPPPGKQIVNSSGACLMDLTPRVSTILSYLAKIDPMDDPFVQSAG
jgi:hypothetical protein